MKWHDITRSDTGNFSILYFTNRNGKELRVAFTQYPQNNTFDVILLDNNHNQIIVADNKKGTLDDAISWCEKYAEKL